MTRTPQPPQSLRPNPRPPGRWRSPVFEPGSVWLAGAGPGDPGLLTLLAFEALEAADIVVYDALVSEEILQLAGREAILRPMGKQAGHRSPKQSEITDLLIAYARDGLKVLRLKGGDPCVFGRGGEEAQALAQAGVPFRIVPGVTAGVGALAYAGIPLTHRGLGSAVTLVSGHDASGALPKALDWDSLAKGSPVLVIYMGLTNIREIAARLMAAGRKPGEAVALVSHGTRENQQVVETTLEACAAAAARHRVRSPALIVVGEVVRLRSLLDWFEPEGAALAMKREARARAG